MATLALISKGESKPQILNGHIVMSSDFKLFPGDLLSYRNNCSYDDVVEKRRGMHILRLGGAEAHVEFNHGGSMSIEIESKSVADFLKLRDEAVRFAGGEVIALKKTFLVCQRRCTPEFHFQCCSEAVLGI